MEYRIVANGSNKYIECLPGINESLIKGEQDALEWIAKCGEEHIQRLMIHAANLTPDFYQLRTGVAGAILQKFVTYSIKVAAILTPELVNQGKFCEMVLESNRGRHFHVFYAIEEAEQWLFRD
jgi:PadR family transcriptional regulator AphA